MIEIGCHRMGVERSRASMQAGCVSGTFDSLLNKSILWYALVAAFNEANDEIVVE